MANGTPTRALGEDTHNENASIEARLSKLEQQSERLIEMLELLLKYYAHHRGADVLTPRTLAKLERDIDASIKRDRAAAA